MVFTCQKRSYSSSKIMLFLHEYGIRWHSIESTHRWCTGRGVRAIFFSSSVSHTRCLMAHFHAPATLPGSSASAARCPSATPAIASRASLSNLVRSSSNAVASNTSHIPQAKDGLDLNAHSEARDGNLWANEFESWLVVGLGAVDCDPAVLQPPRTGLWSHKSADRRFVGPRILQCLCTAELREGYVLSRATTEDGLAACARDQAPGMTPCAVISGFFCCGRTPIGITMEWLHKIGERHAQQNHTQSRTNLWCRAGRSKGLRCTPLEKVRNQWCRGLLRGLVIGLAPVCGYGHVLFLEQFS